MRPFRRESVDLPEIIGIIVEADESGLRQGGNAAMVIVEAGQKLAEAGLVMRLLPHGTELVRRRPWWRRERKRT